LAVSDANPNTCGALQLLGCAALIPTYEFSSDHGSRLTSLKVRRLAVSDANPNTSGAL